MREVSTKKQAPQKVCLSLLSLESFQKICTIFYLLDFLYLKLLKYPDNLSFPFFCWLALSERIVYAERSEVRPQSDLNRCYFLEKEMS